MVAIHNAVGVPPWAGNGRRHFFRQLVGAVSVAIFGAIIAGSNGNLRGRCWA
jgi:hypothetical protein